MQKSFIGKGEIFIGPADGSGAMRSIGNASALVLNIEEETNDQIDYTSASGGLANSLSRISNVNCEITALDISADNLALALRGTNVAVTADSVSNESVTAYHGGLAAFEHTPDTAQSITVTDETDTTTYVENTDYTVTRAGIKILSTGSIADGETLHVSYTKLAGNVIEALTSAASDFRMVFDGLNEAESGKPVIVTIHRVKFNPAQGLGFISDEFGELPLTAAVLKDTSIVGAGISQYMKVAQAA